MGLKHCGKSLLGRMLAQCLQRPFADADSLLEQHYQCRLGGQGNLSCRQIYAKLGKVAFDQLQLAVLQEFIHNCGSQVAQTCPTTPEFIPVGAPVLALGGGAADLAELGPLLRDGQCYTIFLQEALEVLYQRIAEGGLPPFLQGVPNSFVHFVRLSRQRTQRYRCWADLAIDCQGQKPQDILQQIVVGVSGKSRSQ